MRELNSDYEEHLGQVDEPVTGTCEWVLSHKSWRQWYTKKGPALLWFTADAGCGKSVIAKFLVGNLQSSLQSGSKNHICYFFFKEGLEDQDNASAALSAVLHQLCSTQRKLIKHVMAKYTRVSKRAFHRFTSLWQVLMAILSDPTTQDIVWILDGLDECERKSLDEFIKALAMFFDSSTVDIHCDIKIILLSRPHNSIQQKLRLCSMEEGEDWAALPEATSNMVRLAAEEESAAIAKDITRFVLSNIAEFGHNSDLLPDILRQLKDRLINGADFTFLWISLVIKLVRDTETDGISIMQLQYILSTTNLDDVYERLLSNRVLPLKARKALMLVLAAVRPLTLAEICVAIEVHQDHMGENVQARSVLAAYMAANLDNSTMKQVKDSQQVKVYTMTAEQPWRTEDNERMKSTAAFRFRSSAAMSNLSDLKSALHKPCSSHLRQICGHFLRIRSGKVYLVHQTAREFLLSKGVAMSRYAFLKENWPWELLLHDHQQRNEIKNLGNNMTRDKGKLPLPWRHSILLEDANLYLLHICVDYLKLFEFDVELHTDSWTESSLINYLKACRKDLPRALFKYAALHWVDHYRPARQALDYMFDEMLKPHNPLFKIWIRLHPTWTTEEERSKLEKGGIFICNRRRGDETGVHEISMAGSSAKRDEEPRVVSQGTEGFESVLDHFNLTFAEEMESCDQELLAGERYWKQYEDRAVLLDEDAELDDQSDVTFRDTPVYGYNEASSRIPDRINFFRSQYRKRILESYEELSNPLSPAAGNPTRSLAYKQQLEDEEKHLSANSVQTGGFLKKRNDGSTATEPESGENICEITFVRQHVAKYGPGRSDPAVKVEVRDYLNQFLPATRDSER
jgi:hypothetical protein